ncbi:MAG: hypothetical protein ACP5M7_00260 [Thermoproteota archaeon]
MAFPVWEKAEDIFETLPNTIRLTVPSLVGEIFSEEERTYSRTYDAILKAIADGRQVSTEIASYLYSLKLIPTEDPSLVQPYLKILENIGLIEKEKIYGKNKYYYKHVSPVTDYYYYLDAKYGISEREIQPLQARKVLEEKIPHYVEQFMTKLLSKMMGFWAEKIVERDYEIDVALTDFKKLKAVAEIKWKKELTNKELMRIEEKFEKYNCRKILIIPDVSTLPRQPRELEVWDVDTIWRYILKNKIN